MNKYTKLFVNGEFTKEQLHKLRCDILLNSLFLNDYENSFEIDKYLIEDFFNGYVDNLAEIAEENGKANEDYIDFDTTDNLYEWYITALECFEEDNLHAIYPQLFEGEDE